MNAIIQSLKDISERLSQAYVPDEDEMFSASVAAVLRQQHPHQKAMAKLRIQQVLMDIEPTNNAMHSFSFSGYRENY